MKKVKKGKAPRAALIKRRTVIACTFGPYIGRGPTAFDAFDDLRGKAGRTSVNALACKFYKLHPLQVEVKPQRFEIHVKWARS